MLTTADLQWTIIVSTMVLFLFLGLVVLLLVLNANRRQRHRAEMAESQRIRDQEVMLAEREATQQTLREVGRELHDNVAQLLTVAQLGLNTQLAENTSDVHLTSIRDTLDRGIEEVRRLGHDLNYDLWHQRSLMDAICMEAERVERVCHVRCHVVVVGEAQLMPADTSTILFRVFQEILNNALKHSGADTLSITLDASSALVITITDNGAGFDPEGVGTNGGFINIQKRCALVGYSARCTAAKGSGCTWRLIPQVDTSV